ncbi:MAG: exonuclease domain-containing protein [Flavobacteriales bacterium]
MPLILTRPLAVFDLETTGLRIGKDRIVQIGIVRMHPDGTRESWESLVDPQMPIPPDATRVHGIRDEDVAGAPKLEELADLLLDKLDGCDLSGFNCLRFDVPFLSEELLRVGRHWDSSIARIVDVARVYHKMEPRDLTAAVRFYLDQDHSAAHNALADVEATAAVLLAQLNKYEALKGDVDFLGDLSGDQNRPPDPAGKLRYDDQKRVILPFGKHAGKAIEDLVHSDPGYLKWMLGNDFPPGTLAVIRNIIQRAQA